MVEFKECRSFAFFGAGLQHDFYKNVDTYRGKRSTHDAIITAAVATRWKNCSQ